MKQKLNERLYRIHPECATSWQNNWHVTQSSNNKQLRQMASHYNNLNKKLDCLQAKQRRKTKTLHNNKEQQFYPRTKNLTNNKFAKEEMHLLNHGVLYQNKVQR
jgi:hypothetical protein